MSGEKNGREFDYLFGGKNNWRRWQWARMRDALDGRGRVAKAVVVYLAGEHDHDRRLAVSKGFTAENLIAVDESEDVVMGLREMKVLAIKGNILDVAEVWAPDRALDVLVLDLCSGLYKGLRARISTLVGKIHLRDTVFALNLARGREWGFVDYDHGMARANTNVCLELMGSRMRVAEEKKLHRGLAALCHAMIYEAHLLMGRMKQVGGGLVIPDIKEGGGFDDTVALVLQWMLIKANASIHTYWSPEAKQNFDGIVWRNPVGGILLEGSKAGLIDSGMINRWIEMRREEIRAGGRKALRRRMAATLAHRTMRINEGRGDV